MISGQTWNLNLEAFCKIEVTITIEKCKSAKCWSLVHIIAADTPQAESSYYVGYAKLQIKEVCGNVYTT